MERRMNLSKRILWALLVTSAFFPQVVLSRPHIAIEPYGAVVDDVTGDVKVYGQLVVQRAFDVQLRDVIKHVPIFSVQYAGLHHRAKDQRDTGHVEARAKCIAERLAAAWSLLDQGGQLEVLTDDWTEWRLEDAIAATYAPAPEVYPAIYIRNDKVLREPLRILTIYPEDEVAYPWVSTENELAEYIVSLIRAHYLLFWRMESDINQYEQLMIDHTREGKIFKEVAIRALEMTKLKELERFDGAILIDALARIALPQRERLYRMATTAPIDWESSQ